jgi:hypothetical protein
MGIPVAFILPQILPLAKLIPNLTAYFLKAHGLGSLFDPKIHIIALQS